MDRFLNVIRQLPAIFLGLALLTMASMVIFYAYNLFVVHGVKIDSPTKFGKQPDDALLTRPVILNGDQFWEQKPDLTKTFNFKSPQLSKMLADKQKAVQANPKDFKTLEEVAFLNLYTGKLYDSKIAYNTVAEKNPKDRSARLSLAYIYFFTGNHSQAVTIVDSLMEENSQDQKLIKIKQTIVEDQKKKEEEAKKKTPPPEVKKPETQQNKKPQEGQKASEKKLQDNQEKAKK